MGNLLEKVGLILPSPSNSQSGAQASRNRLLPNFEVVVQKSLRDLSPGRRLSQTGPPSRRN